MNAVDQVTEHLSSTRVIGADAIEDGDIVTAAVVIVRVERADEAEPEFLIMHSGDYITATGLITLAKGVVTNGLEDDE